METKSRNREGNFSPPEVELLIELCNQHKSLLENKTTNSVTWKKKAEIWEVITNAFNATTDRQVRKDGIRI